MIFYRDVVLDLMVIDDLETSNFLANSLICSSFPSQYPTFCLLVLMLKVFVQYFGNIQFF